LLNLTAVQETVDGNPAIGQDTSVDQVAVDGSGGQVGTSTSAVALPDFTIVVNTRNGTDPVNQAALTITLQDYMEAGMMDEYPDVVAVESARTQIATISSDTRQYFPGIADR
jgi:hypothetical protein